MLSTNSFHIAFYIIAILISFTSLVYTVIQQRTDRLQNKLFLSMLLAVVLNCLSVIVCALVEPYKHDSHTAYVLLEIFQFSYFFFHATISSILFFYVCSVVGIIEQFSFRKKLLYSTPLIITEFFIVTNPLMHWVYYYDENKQFTRNWAEATMYIVAVLLLVLSVYYLFRFWNAINHRRQLMLVYFFVVAIVGMIIQLFNINIKSELLGESIALMGLMLAVENEDDRIDADTDVYNRKALHLDLNNYFVTKRRFKVLVVHIVNSDIIQRMTGSANLDILVRLVVDYFRTIVPKYHIYRANPSIFVLICMEEDVTQIAKKIEKRFESSWGYQEIDVMLNSAILYASVPEELKTHEDVFYMIDSPLPGVGTEKVMHGNALDYLMRRGNVESAIHRGMADGHFEVYYQPTYHMEGMKLHGAEALLRLNDPELGFISPEEFIPVAEQVGMINEIGNFVLRQVCSFWQSGIPKQHGMESINVNLSVIQCMQPGFVKNILSIVDSFKVPHENLDFEITESVAASDYNVLSSVIQELKQAGFLFSMDDYGTGYSNMQSVFELDFDIIKIDKSILWAAEKESTGRAILENSARMILQIGKKILVEGVETQEQIELLRPLQVDYLQGYFFSKPLPKQEFIELIQRGNGKNG